MSLPDNRTIDNSILRAADIRGVAGLTLDSRTAELIGKAFGTILIRQGLKKVVVGGDGRLSTPELSLALIKGLLSCGLNVTEIGCGPTPMLYFAAFMTEDSGGIMVTASHNPKEYNGFKMLVNRRSFCAENIQKLGELIECGDFETGKGLLKREHVLAHYTDRLLQDFRSDGKELTVIWDCGNGTAGVVVPDLVGRLPGRHIILNEKVDGNFPAHAPDSSKIENLTELRETVLREKADLGLAFDGDSDRLGVIDADGNLLETDKLLPIFAEEILKTHPQAVFIADIKSSKTFSEEIARMGGKPLIWRTGHSFIKQKMRETNSPLGGEMSGHICFADKYYGFDDALYAAIRLLDIAAHQQQETLQDRINRIPQTFATPEIQIPCPDSEKFLCIAKIKAELRKKGLFYDETDGIKLVFPSSGWGLIRASNTSPCLVARCEADTQEELERIKKILFQQIKDIYPIEIK
ncbi:MAG: phosphomannomutase/phosphoglucomutase [Alphaproteobacteria bacterium]|nr:phosphomannomutase/phosphoglucomutase [Alphaproteobacteria bacterium]